MRKKFLFGIVWELPKYTKNFFIIVRISRMFCKNDPRIFKVQRESSKIHQNTLRVSGMPQEFLKYISKIHQNYWNSLQILGSWKALWMVKILKFISPRIPEMHQKIYIFAYYVIQKFVHASRVQKKNKHNISNFWLIAKR